MFYGLFTIWLMFEAKLPRNAPFILYLLVYALIIIWPISGAAIWYIIKIKERKG